MYEQDVSWAGFEWINANDSYRGIFSFVRKSKSGKNDLLFVCNFTPVAYDDYRVGVLNQRKHKLILNSEDAKYGGTDTKRQVSYTPKRQECDGREYSNIRLAILYRHMEWLYLYFRIRKGIYGRG